MNYISTKNYLVHSLMSLSLIKLNRNHPNNTKCFINTKHLCTYVDITQIATSIKVNTLHTKNEDNIVLELEKGITSSNTSRSNPSQVLGPVHEASIRQRLS